MDEYLEEGRDALDREEYRDQRSDFGQVLPTNWNLAHLTISQTALWFFNKHEILNDLIPLIDQIMSTTNLDNRGVELYQCMITSQIAEIMLWTDEDDNKSFQALTSAEIYLFMLLEGMRKGYRGKLATELRRTYRREYDLPEKKRGLFR